jgi:hypothetical protein
VKAINIPKEMGFKGWYAIEDCVGPGPFAGKQKIIDALLEVI